jgi:hypothetical protein
MDIDPLKEERIAALRDEIEAIHSANTLYWTSQEHSRAATAEYRRRIERLEEIRIEFDQLTRPKPN